MSYQLFTYYTQNPLVIISTNSGISAVIVVWLELETWVIHKGALIEQVESGDGERGTGTTGCCVPFVCISTVVADGACVGDFSGLGVCKVGTVG
jgi:hypothetical protein